MTAEPSGLPPPPPAGETALRPGAFDGSTVLVTGGGTGLGKAVAAEFARLGASIVIASRSADHLEAGRAAMEQLGAPVATAACDIRDPTAVAAAFDAADAAFGLPDVLVNNAAANFPVPAEDMSPNAWRAVVDITLNGTFNCTRELGRRHLAAATPASVINIGASYAWTGGPGFAHSAAAKAGVKSLTESLAVEWVHTGSRSTAWCRACSPTRHDIRHPFQPGPHQRQGRLPARAARGGAPGAGLGGHVPGVAVRTIHLGPHPGGGRANWLRRTMTSPPVVTVRDQMGRGPFQLSS